MFKRLRNMIAGHEQLLMIIIAASLNLLFVFVHECWRDEAQAWLIARDNTIFSLFDVTSYEGHPCLWFFVLMPFARLGFPYFTLKLISYFIMLAVIILIAVKAPFENYLKAIFILSPMCIYCFVTPARNYCLCALFIVLSAMAFKDRDKHPLRYGLVLALTLQTHIIMAGFVVASCCEWAWSVLREFYTQKKLTSNITLRGGGMIIPFLSGLFLLFEFRDTEAASIYDPHFLQWWESFFFMAFCLFIFAVREKLKIVSVFIIFILAILWQLWIHVFVYPIINFRDITWGFLLLWLTWRLYDININIKNMAIPVAMLALLFSFCTWREFYRDILRDVIRPYSGAERVAAAIDMLPEDAVIFESKEDWCNSVIPYLKTKTIYNPFSESEASYMDRNPKLRHSMSYDEFVSISRSMFPDNDCVWVLCPYKTDMDITGLNKHLDDENLYYTDDNIKIVYPDEHFSIHCLKL